MIPGNCCFCIPIKTSVIMIAFGYMVVSFLGVLLSTSSVLNYLTLPEDPLLQWLLQVCYFLDVYGIVFHSMLLMVSILMAYGVLANVPLLLIPWLGWSPFVLTFILVQMAFVLIKGMDLVLPIVTFCFMIYLVVVYGFIVVAVYYKEMRRSGTVQLRFFNLGGVVGERPRIVEVLPLRFFRHPPPFGREAAMTSSTIPLREQSAGGGISSDPGTAEMKRKLTEAYTRYLDAANEDQSSSPEETRF